MAKKSTRSGKSGIDLTKDSGFQAAKKSEPTRAIGQGLGVGIRGQVGTIGGFDVEAEISADVGRLLPGGKLDVGITKTADGATEVDAGVGGRIVSPIGGFGLGVGGKISINSEGGIEIESISGKIEAGGVSVELTTDENGKVTAEVCYTFGIISTCISIQPDEEGKKSVGVVPSIGPNDGAFDPDVIPNFNPNCKYSISVLCLDAATEFKNCLGYGSNESTQGFMFESSNPLPGIYAKFGQRIKHPSYDYYYYKIENYPPPVGYVEIRQLGGSRPVVKGDLIKGAGPWYKDDAPKLGSDVVYAGGSYYYDSYWTAAHNLTAAEAKRFYANFKYQWPMAGWASYRIKVDQKCPGQSESTPLDAPAELQLAPPLPNPPQKNHMNDECCKLIKEIHKYLGIEKLKRNKFPIANEFLVAGGTGNTDCVDQYEINQALFRMLANGLIINPKSKPLGTDWQSANATSWAGGMYEMMAEAMGDGNSTQRVEIAMMMQLTQIMSALAETSRKVEFIIDALGYEPEIESEDLPVCFTIHEEHKGFGKKEPKKINVSGSKTDEQVEAILGKMLNPSKIPITKWVFNPNHISVNEALRSNG